MKRLLKAGDIFRVNSADHALKPGDLYIVVETKMAGGVPGYGPHDVYPDGHKVTASKLKSNVYQPTHRTVSFYQTGCFNGMIEPHHISLVATKKKVVKISFV